MIKLKMSLGHTSVRLLTVLGGLHKVGHSFTEWTRFIENEILNTYRQWKDVSVKHFYLIAYQRDCTDEASLSTQWMNCCVKNEAIKQFFTNLSPTQVLGRLDTTLVGRIHLNRFGIQMNRISWVIWNWIREEVSYEIISWRTNLFTLNWTVLFDIDRTKKILS